jgi:hypothetical protein
MITEKTMHLANLKAAENAFLKRYPGGFEHPDLLDIGRKHRVPQMIEQAQTRFTKRAFADPQAVIQDMVYMVSRSSMVSMFEKPKFRDFAKTLNSKEAKQLSDGLKKFLHAKQHVGMQDMLDILKLGKLAKWSILTIIPNYYRPDTEVFIKPTTAKGVIQYFGLKDIKYNPTPSWDFYEKYRDEILGMRQKVDACIAPNNAAFCGFLMMSMK